MKYIREMHVTLQDNFPHLNRSALFVTKLSHFENFPKAAQRRRPVTDMLEEGKCVVIVVFCLFILDCSTSLTIHLTPSYHHVVLFFINIFIPSVLFNTLPKIIHI